MGLENPVLLYDRKDTALGRSYGFRHRRYERWLGLGSIPPLATLCIKIVLNVMKRNY